MRPALPATCGLLVLALTALPRAGGGQPPGAPPKGPAVTAVTGPSWLTRLGVALAQTSIGRASGQYGPTTPPAPPAPAALNVPATVTLTGGDLYRLNCQACHGVSGGGSPPEITSAVDPVRGASIDVLRQQMKAQHQPAGAAEARSQPGRVRAGILARMHRGGQRMPSREHLSDHEVSLVFDYLTMLATPESRAGAGETVLWMRLGEHVVKGTCHICHDAVGAPPSDQARIAGAIPSLAAMMASQSVADFVTKARTGAPVRLPSLGMSHRGRMPVFAYLRNEDIAAAYMYLASHPPRR